MAKKPAVTFDQLFASNDPKLLTLLATAYTTVKGPYLVGETFAADMREDKPFERYYDLVECGQKVSAITPTPHMVVVRTHRSRVYKGAVVLIIPMEDGVKLDVSRFTTSAKEALRSSKEEQRRRKDIVGTVILPVTDITEHILVEAAAAKEAKEAEKEAKELSKAAEKTLKAAKETLEKVTTPTFEKTTKSTKTTPKKTTKKSTKTTPKKATKKSTKTTPKKTTKVTPKTTKKAAKTTK